MENVGSSGAVHGGADLGIRSGRTPELGSGGETRAAAKRVNKFLKFEVFLAMFDLPPDTTGWLLTILLVAALLALVAGMAARWRRP